MSQDCTSSQADVIFVVDSSGSICDTDPDFTFGEDTTCNNWMDLLEFINLIIDELPISSDGSENRVALVRFANDGQLIFDFDDNNFSKATIRSAVTSLPYVGGNTATAGGLQVVIDQLLDRNGNRADVDDIVIVITDGKSTM